MRHRILAIGGIIFLIVLLWWVITFVANGGWPSSGPVGGTLPPHIQYVFPADGEKVEESYGFCAHFFYPAGRGMGDDPQQAIRYFMDGKNVTEKVLDIVALEYGYPDPMGEPCYKQTEPLSSRWHTIKVTYVDSVGEDFEYMWRFQVLNEK
jgi:hypothetical protein